MRMRCVRIASFVLLFSWAAVPFAVAQDTKPAGGPRLEISATEWNFGEVWQGTPLSFEVRLTNTGDAPLTLEPKSSCGCTVPTRPKSPLAPGESDQMVISYDAVRRRGPAHHTVTLTTNDPQRPTVVITVRGTVKPVYEVSPMDNLTFGRLFRDAEETRRVEIVNRYVDRMSLRIRSGVDVPGFTLELKELEPGVRYELSARTRPPLAVGLIRREVVLETGLSVLPEMRVVLFATVQPPIAVSPDKLTWPRNLVSPLETVVRVLHAPAQPVRIVQARPTHPAIAVTIRDVGPGASAAAQPVATAPATRSTEPVCTQEIVVHLPAGVSAPESGDVAIELQTDANDPAYQKITIPVRVVGTTTAGPRPPATSPAGQPVP